MTSLEEKAYAVFGIEKPNQQPEAAEPAALESAAGGNEQGVTAPARADQNNEERPEGADQSREAGNDRPGGSAAREDATDPGETGEQGGGELSPSSDRTGEPDSRTEEPEAAAGKQTMSKAERAEQARLRRERETAAKIEAAVQAERERNEGELTELLKSLGLTDRYHDNRPITSKEELEQWQQANKAAGLNRRIKSGELTAEDLQAMVEDNPTVRAVKANMEELEQKTREAKAEQARAEFETVMRRELEEIRRLDPSVKSLEDVLNKPTGKEFAQLVQENGLNYVQAFRLANADRLAETKARLAAQGQATQDASKSHMRPALSNGALAAEIPAATLRIYRTMRPDLTPEQIRQDYQKQAKDMGL